MNKIVLTARPHAYFLFFVAIMATISAIAFGTAELIEHQQSYYPPAVQTIKEAGYMTTTQPPESSSSLSSAPHNYGKTSLDVGVTDVQPTPPSKLKRNTK